MDFVQKNAVVIGGTSSIGKCISSLLIEESCNVTVTGRICGNLKAEYIKLDFIDNFNESVDNQSLNKALENADILVICFGPFCYKKVHETLKEDWLNLSINDYALPGILVSRCLPFMMKKKWGRIILFGGTRTDSIRAYHSNAAYAGVKTGISVLTKSVAMEYASYGITCNAILPGFTSNAPEGTLEVSEEIIAKNVMHLLRNSELNGVLLNIDRGWSI